MKISALTENQSPSKLTLLPAVVGTSTYKITIANLQKALENVSATQSGLMSIEDKTKLDTAISQLTQIIEGGGNISTPLLINHSVTPIKTSFLSPGKNLFNASLALDNMALSFVDGIESASTGKITSSFIEVTPESMYAISGGLTVPACKICFYKSTLEYTGSYIDLVDNDVITVPTDMYYMKISFDNSKLNVFQVEAGDTVTDYEIYHSKFEGIDLSALVNYAITDSVTPTVSGIELRIVEEGGVYKEAGIATPYGFIKLINTTAGKNQNNTNLGDKKALFYDAVNEEVTWGTLASFSDNAVTYQEHSPSVDPPITQQRQGQIIRDSETGIITMNTVEYPVEIYNPSAPSDANIASHLADTDKHLDIIEQNKINRAVSYLKTEDQDLTAEDSTDCLIYFNPITQRFGIANDQKFQFIGNGLVGTKEVNEAAIANGKILAYNSATGKLVYIDPATGGLTDIPDDVVTYYIGATSPVSVPVGGMTMWYDTVTGFVTLCTNEGNWQINEMCGSKVVDESAIANGKILMFNSTSQKVEYVALDSVKAEISDVQTGTSDRLVLRYNDQEQEFGVVTPDGYHRITDKVGTKPVVETDIATNKILQYNGTSLVYVALPSSLSNVRVCANAGEEPSTPAVGEIWIRSDL